MPDTLLQFGLFCEGLRFIQDCCLHHFNNGQPFKVEFRFDGKQLYGPFITQTPKENTCNPSGFLKLNWRDLLRGLIVAAGTVILTNAVGILNSGRLPTQAEMISMAIQGLSAIGTYLLMNYFTPGKPQPPVQGNGV